MDKATCQKPTCAQHEDFDAKRHRSAICSHPVCASSMSMPSEDLVDVQECNADCEHITTGKHLNSLHAVRADSCCYAMSVEASP